MSNKARLFLKDIGSYTDQEVENGGFNGNLNFWNVDTTGPSADWFYDSGQAKGKFGRTGRIYQNLTIVPGVKYTIKFDLNIEENIWRPGGDVDLQFGGTTIKYTTSGRKTEVITAVVGSAIYFKQSFFFGGSIDNVSVTFESEGGFKYQELHLADDTFINLNFSIADVEDISKRGTTFSKTIQLPSTTHNDSILEHIYELDSLPKYKYLNRKIPAYLYYDDAEILNGICEITRVETIQEDNRASYEIVLRGNTKTFADVVASKYLTGNIDSSEDIDFSEYNHIFTVNNISKTWYNPSFPAKPTSNYGSGYYYPIINYNDKKDNQYNFEELRPAIYIKEILDKIFADAGYTYTSSFLESTYFKSLITPFVNKLRTSEDELERRKFRAGLESDIVNQEGYGSAGSSTQANRFLYHGPASSVSNVAFNLPIRDDSENPPLDFFDNGGNFSAGQKSYIVPAKGMYNFDFQAIARPYLYDATVGVAAGQYIARANDGGQARMEATVYMFRKRGNARSVVIGSNTIAIPLNSFETAPGGFTSTFFNSRTWIQNVGHKKTALKDVSLSCSSNNLEFEEGDRIFVQIVLNNKLSRFYDLLGRVANTNAFYGTLDLFRENPDNSGNAGLAFWNTPLASDGMFLGDTFDMNALLPKKVKQIDFVNSLVKMFNLIIEEDPDKTKNLLIEPRNDYFALGSANPKNWSAKLDRGQAVEIERIPTLIDKNISFKYKDDNDKYNEDYIDTYEDGYANWEISNEELTKEEEKVEVIFAPTPGDEIPGTNIIVPQIFSVDDNDEYINQAYKMRILHRVDIIDAPGSTFDTVNSSGVKVVKVSKFEGSQIVATSFLANTIPTASHLDDPYAPSKDLNWGYSQQYYNTVYPVVPSLPSWGNLYNEYWRDYVELLLDKNSKIITGQFNLTEQDVYNFRFYDKIHLDGQFYTVNKIIDWNPNVLTTVELIKNKISELPETSVEKTEDTEEVLEYNDIRYRRSMVRSKQRSSTVAKRQSGRSSFSTATPKSRRMYAPTDNPLEVNSSGNTWNQLSGSTAITLTVTASTEAQATIITPESRGYATGVNNNIDSRNFFVAGNDNNYSGVSYNTMAVGDGNTFGNNVSNVRTLGSNNKIEGNLENVNVIGDNITVTKSDTLVLGGQTILSQTPIESIVNIIASTDLDNKVINPFNRQKQVQVLCGGDIDEGVRSLRSCNTTFVVDSRTTPTVNYDGFAEIEVDADGNPV